MSHKKNIRRGFREACFRRDDYRCRVCGVRGRDRQAPGGDESLLPLDCHHIIPREQIANGGYVPANGISLCPACHVLAEQTLLGDGVPGYSPERLFALIGSSETEARRQADLS